MVYFTHKHIIRSCIHSKCSIKSLINNQLISAFAIGSNTYYLIKLVLKMLIYFSLYRWFSFHFNFLSVEISFRNFRLRPHYSFSLSNISIKISTKFGSLQRRLRHCPNLYKLHHSLKILSYCLDKLFTCKCLRIWSCCDDS